MEIENFFPGGSNLTWQDYAVLLAVLALVIFVGFYFGRGEKSTADFFLGRRKIPWWAAGFAFVAAETSALTLIAVPAIAYMENWEYAQFLSAIFWRGSPSPFCLSRPFTGLIAPRFMNF